MKDTTNTWYLRTLFVISSTMQIYDYLDCECTYFYHSRWIPRSTFALVIDLQLFHLYIKVLHAIILLNNIFNVVPQILRSERCTCKAPVKPSLHIAEFSSGFSPDYG